MEEWDGEGRGKERRERTGKLMEKRVDRGVEVIIEWRWFVKYL